MVFAYPFTHFCRYQIVLSHKCPCQQQAGLLPGPGCSSYSNPERDQESLLPGLLLPDIHSQLVLVLREPIVTVADGVFVFCCPSDGQKVSPRHQQRWPTSQGKICSAGWSLWGAVSVFIQAFTWHCTTVYFSLCVFFISSSLISLELQRNLLNLAGMFLSGPEWWRKEEAVRYVWLSGLRRWSGRWGAALLDRTDQQRGPRGALPQDLWGVLRRPWLRRLQCHIWSTAGG